MSVFGETELVRKQAGVQESSGPFVANASVPIQIGCESDLAFLLGKHTKYSDSLKKKKKKCKLRPTLFVVPIVCRFSGGGLGWEGGCVFFVG